MITMKKIIFRKRLSDICILLLSMCISLTMYSCKRGIVSEGEETIDTIINEPSSPSEEVNDIKVNIYIENSGSMDGFIKGVTDFKSDIGNLLADVKYQYDEENIKIYFIHNDTHEILRTSEASTGQDLADVAQWIGIEWKKEPRGSNTKLNNIFKKILERTDDKTVSILISDCIYSIGKSGKTIDLLDHEKTTTKDAFLTRSKKGDIKLATSIYRMTSLFDGWYYPYTGDANRFSFKGELPYYICVFADNNVMNDFCSKIKISEKDYKGYNNRYSIAHISTEEPYWSVLPLTNKKGRFQKIRGNNSIYNVHGIENVEHDRSGAFSFSVAVDMSGVNVQEDYLLDPSNYILDNSRYIISSITSFNKDDVNPSDMIMLQKSPKMPTHIITIEATGTAVCDLEIALERKLPHWVDQFNIMDDTKPAMIKNCESFGLRYWIEGISRAYETLYPNDNAYFNFKITIKK